MRAVRPTVDAGPVAGHDAFVDDEAAECGEVVVDLAQDVVDGGFVVRPRRSKKVARNTARARTTCRSARCA
jgi:hypothetical protein